jgi:hypothetical protein
MIHPTTLYVGARDAIIAEVGGMAHIYPGKYLAYPQGDAEYDAEGVNTKAELKEVVALYRREFPGIQICYVS